MKRVAVASQLAARPAARAHLGFLQRSVSPGWAVRSARGSTSPATTGDPPPAERPAHLGRCLQESEMRPRRGVYGTGTGVRAQICRAYSRMVRSLENLPTRAVLRIAIFAHLD